VYAQEYGRYFGMNVGIFRGGCLTGPSHSGVELHGFLSYLLKVAYSGGVYTVYGYKGKQVRDNLHSFDVVRAFEEFASNPRPGEVYNLGGGRGNSISILEAIARVEALAGRKMTWAYNEHARRGDHICYISNLAKFTKHYPAWSVTRGLDATLEEMARAELARGKAQGGAPVNESLPRQTGRWETARLRAGQTNGTEWPLSSTKHPSIRSYNAIRIFRMIHAWLKHSN